MAEGAPEKRSVIAITALAAMSFVVSATTPFGVTSRDISGEVAQQQVFEGFGLLRLGIFSTAGVENPPAGNESFAVTVYLTRMRPLAAAGGGTGP